jgi:hypothetical protein
MYKQNLDKAATSKIETGVEDWNVIVVKSAHAIERVRLIKNTISEVHKERLATRVYEKALRDLEGGHKRQVVDPAEYPQLTALTKKLGVDLNKNPRFIMKLGDDESQDYVACVNKQLVVFRKSHLGDGWTDMMYKDAKAYVDRGDNKHLVWGWTYGIRKKQLAKGFKEKTEKTAAEMSKASVHQQPKRLHISAGQKVHNEFGMKSHHPLTLGDTRAPDGIQLIKLEGGHLNKYGESTLRAPTVDKIIAQQSERRRQRRQELNTEGVEAMQTRLAEQHYTTIAAEAGLNEGLNTWVNQRIPAVLQDRPVSVVYRSHAGQDIVLFSNVENNTRTWHLGVPDAHAAGFNQAGIVRELIHAPRRPNTRNQFRVLDRPTEAFTLQTDGRLPAGMVQIRLGRNPRNGEIAGMRLLHPSIREQVGARVAVIRDVVPAAAPTAEAVAEPGLDFGARNLEAWAVENDLVMHSFSKKQVKTLNQWAATMMPAEMQNRRLAVTFVAPDGTHRIIVRNVDTARRTVTWGVLAPRGIEPNQVEVLNVIRNQQDFDPAVHTTLRTPADEIPFRRTDATGRVQYPTDIVQFVLFRNGTPPHHVVMATRATERGIETVRLPATVTPVADARTTTPVITPVPVVTRVAAPPEEIIPGVFIDPVTEFADANNYFMVEMTPELSGRVDAWITEVIQGAGLDTNMTQRVFVTVPIGNGQTAILEGYQHQWNILTPLANILTTAQIATLLGDTRTLPRTDTNSEVFNALESGVITTDTIRTADPNAVHIRLARNNIGNIAGLRMEIPGREPVERTTGGLTEELFSGVDGATVSSEQKLLNAPAEILNKEQFSEIRETGLLEPVDDVQNTFFDRWITTIALDKGIKNTDRVVVNMVDEATGLEYQIVKDGHKVFRVMPNGIDTSDINMMKNTPLMNDVQRGQLAHIEEHPEIAGSDYTKMFVTKRGGVQRIGIVPSRNSTQISVELPVESDKPLPKVEVAPVSVAGFEHAVPVGNEYLSQYVKDRVAEVLKQANINNEAPTVVRFKDESGQVVDLLVSGNSVSIVSQSNETPAQWYKALAGNMQPIDVVTTTLDNTVNYNRVGIDQDAENNVKAFVIPAVTATPVVTSVPAMVDDSTPIAAPAGTIFAPQPAANDAVAVATNVPLTAASAQPFDVDALRRDLGIT